MGKLTYKDAGVDLKKAEDITELFYPLCERTFSSNVIRHKNGFSGCFTLRTKMKNAVLVSSVDGVGTKTKIAVMAQRFDTIGIDCVAVNVNDILTTGASPLFFLDYIGVQCLNPQIVGKIVEGIAFACMQCGCSFIGGETAEMPGVISENAFDLVGMCVGIVEMEKMLRPQKVKEGDVIVGLKSSGIHANGFALVRKALFDKAGFSIDTYIPELGKSLGEELLLPTKIYLHDVRKGFSLADIHCAGHISGGGLLRNIRRALPQHLDFWVDFDSWEPPVIFDIIQRLGGIDMEEMRRVFNLGIGFVLITDEETADRLCIELNGTVIGRIIKR